MLNKVSILVSVVVGLVLLAQFVADARRPQDPLPRPETARAEAETPPPLDTETVKAALAEIVLPPPPALNRPEPQAAPEPKVTVMPMAPAEPEPVPVVEVTPIKADIPEPTPEPVVTVKPLKPAELTPKPEPVVAVKPLQAEQPAPEPEPAITIKPLKVETAKAKPEPVSEPDPVVTVKPLKVAARRPVVEPKPQPRPMPKPRAEPTPRPMPDQPKTVQVSVRTNGPLASEGRALLRLLEHGSGPGIEIAWPRDRRGQQTLHRVLAGCYGMRTVIMDGQGNLFHAEGPRGLKWDLNLDRFSGFVRQPSGWLAAAERESADAIRRYHGLRGANGPVRLFPRQVDAVLLGGLHEILGSRYRTARSIRATYRLDGERLFVEGIRVDGTAVAGRIAFSAIGGRCRA